MSVETQADWQVLMAATLIPPASPLPSAQQGDRTNSTRPRLLPEAPDRDSQRFLRLEPEPR